MKRLRAVTVGLVLASAMFALGWYANVAAQQGSRPRVGVESLAASAKSDSWAPQFPRDGAEKVFENERVIVWDETYTTEPHMHMHMRDVVVVALEDGVGRTVRPDGTSRDIPLKGGKIPRFSSYMKAGAGPHAEFATDPKRVPRKLWIELKGTELPGLRPDGRFPKK